MPDPAYVNFFCLLAYPPTTTDRPIIFLGKDGLPTKDWYEAFIGQSTKELHTKHNEFPDYCAAMGQMFKKEQLDGSHVIDFRFTELKRK